MTEDEIIQQIKVRRRELKLSQSHIAERLHISVKAYQNIEHGVTRLDLGRIRELADILKVDLQYLMFPAQRQTAASLESYRSEKEAYLKIIQDKETYISVLEDRLSYYRALIKEHNCI